MHPKEFKESNFRFTKPAGTTDDQVKPLPVHRGTTTDNKPVIVSCWELSDEELEELARTKKLWLLIYGNGMSPVSIQTESPFQ